MCNQKRGSKNHRREQSNSGRVGLIPQSEGKSASAQEGQKRAKDTSAIFSSLLFLFLFIPNSKCSRKVFAPWTRRQSPMVQKRERQPHNQLRLFVAPALASGHRPIVDCGQVAANSACRRRPKIVSVGVLLDCWDSKLRYVP